MRAAQPRKFKGGRYSMKQSKRTVFIAMLALAAIFVSSAAFAAEEIKVGALFPLTGPAAVSGQNCVNAVQAAVEVINALENISVTKAAGGKWNIAIIETDTTTGSVIKEDIPKAAVEKPTLSTDPTVNAR